MDARKIGLVAVMALSLAALGGCTKGSCTLNPGTLGEACIDDYNKSTCQKMSGATFDDKPCAALGRKSAGSAGKK